MHWQDEKIENEERQGFDNQINIKDS